MTLKKVTAIGIALALGLLLINAVYAHWWGSWWGGPGMQRGIGANIENVQKFQKETLPLRDELTTKELELQNEYSKSNPDYDRAATLEKGIVDLQAKIGAVANKYGVSGWGPMRGMMGRCTMGPRHTYGCCW